MTDELTFEDIEAVLDKMSTEERETIETLAVDMRESIRQRSRDAGRGETTVMAMMGRQGSLTLIAKLGMFMNKHDWNGD